MAISDSSSDSDTDCSESVDNNVELALDVIKERLTKTGRVPCVQNVPRRNSYLRQKLYDTFTSTNSSSDSETEQDQAESNQTVTNFFIDRVSGPANCAKPDQDNSAGVETVDLSNLDIISIDNGQTASDNKKTKSKRKKKKNKNKSHELSSQLKSEITTNDVYINVDPLSKQDTQKHGKNKELRHKEPEIMKKSVFKDDYEKADSIKSVHTSHRKEKKERKLEREKTKGDKWHHMPAVELTEEQKNDLKVIQMRKALDPKRFYKANDSEETPKFVQFGRVVESAADFYDSRIPKKQRKATIVEELLADTEFRSSVQSCQVIYHWKHLFKMFPTIWHMTGLDKNGTRYSKQYNKRKYEEIQESRRLGKGPYAHMKRLKKHKK